MLNATENIRPFLKLALTCVEQVERQESVNTLLPQRDAVYDVNMFISTSSDHVRKLDTPPQRADFIVRHFEDLNKWAKLPFALAIIMSPLYSHRGEVLPVLDTCRRCAAWHPISEIARAAS